jgi:adenylate kinase
VTRIPKETFAKLQPETIVLLAEKPDVIAARRKQRDNIDRGIGEVERLQAEEAAYAAETDK